MASTEVNSRDSSNSKSAGTGLAETIAQSTVSPTAIDLPELENAQIRLPRVTIEFCVKCKWGLRAAYYAQELLSTFCSTDSLSISEVSLLPSLNPGTFIIKIYHPVTLPISGSCHNPPPSIRQVTTSLPLSPGTIVKCFYVTTLWDRKLDGRFPETKELKRRVRDVVEPGRDLGHVDRTVKKTVDRKEKKGGDGAGDGEVGEGERDGERSVRTHGSGSDQGESEEVTVVRGEGEICRDCE